MINYEINNYNSELELFRYVNPKCNDMISKMKGLDLQEFLILLDNYYLTLREKLFIDEKITLGVEIEFKHNTSNISNSELSKIISEKINQDIWRVVYDHSIPGGGEVNSPIMQNQVFWWEKLQQVCSILNQYAHINGNCGGHIHVGAHILDGKKENWLNFLKLWATYENIIYRFSYGEYLTPRNTLESFAIPIAREINKNYLKFKKKQITLENLSEIIRHPTCSAVSFRHISDYAKFKENNTFEIRCPNGTLEPVIWQNNINFFVHLLNYSKSNSFDEYIIRKRKLSNLFIKHSLESYNQIYLKQALELCDMIFNNNLDKIYFLRQYLKSFKIGTTPFSKSKNFILKK